MKVFVSSVVTGFEPFRDAVERAARVLGHDVKRSEDFGASPDSPQQACLAGVRWADVVVLVLGERYGEVQPSGLSATHEEYREAHQERDLLAFLQRDIKPEAAQQAFIEEVRAWAGGVLTGGFATAEGLDDEVTRALHTLELARQTAPLDEAEVAERASSLVPERQGFHGPSLCLAVAGGPRRQVIRPAQLDDRELHRDLHRELLLGEHAVFDTTEGVRARTEGSALHLEQDHASFVLDAFGSVGIVIRPTFDGAEAGLPLIIEEDISDRIARTIRLSGSILDRIDPVGRLTHVAPVVALLSGSHLGWQTRVEHQANPSSVQISMNVGDRLLVALTPAVRPRATLTHKVGELTEDFVAILRREYKR